VGNHVFYSGTGPSEYMRITSTGNVGIGSSLPQQTLDVAGNVNVLNTVIMGSSFLRNRIINGGMQVWQRGTSFSGVASGGYTADRMYIGYTGSAPTVTQVTGPTGFTYAARITGAVGNTVTTLGQKIESYNCVDLASKTVTVSVVLLASVAQTFSWYLGYANAADNFGSITQIATGSWSVTTTAATYSATISLPAGAANGLQFQVYPAAAGAFTSGTCDITGLQLEAGPVATPFERKTYGQVLLDCQRYYYRILNNTVTGFVYVGFGRIINSTYGDVVVNLPVAMRAFPTINYTSVGSFQTVNSTATGISTEAGNYSTNTVNFVPLYVTPGAATAGLVQVLQTNSNTAGVFIDFSAEL